MNIFSNIVISFTWIAALHEIPNVVDSQDDDKSVKSYLWTQCYERLGCLNNTDDWYHRLLRPISDQPLPSHIIKTTFILFAKGKHGRHGFIAEPIFPEGAQIRGTNFDDTKLKTHLLIHDFTSNGRTGWISRSAKSMIDINAGNVISVDWTGGAEPPYSVAVQNARLVALEIIILLRTFFNEFGIKPHQFHLIGHGLGAHVAGYVGKRIKGIGRITGLDPAGLYFDGMPPPVHLDHRDANFVDVINTNSFEKKNGQGQGSRELYGRFNFFPNGGRHQPGCNATLLYPRLDQISREMLKEGEIAPGCDHKRAAKYFTASIDERNQCIPIGFACSDYETFKRGECTGECNDGSTCIAPMGYSVDFNGGGNLRTKYFLDTNDDRPYCMFAYKITIALVRGRPEVEEKEQPPETGLFRATVYSETEGLTFGVTLNQGMGEKRLKLEGKNVYLTYQKPPKLIRPSKILLRFEPTNNATIIHVRYVGMNILPDNGNGMTYLCGREELIELKSNDEGKFLPCDKMKFNIDGINVLGTSRQRRNPDGEKYQVFQAPDDVSDYDESEPPEPVEDDYYSNR